MKEKATVGGYERKGGMEIYGIRVPEDSGQGWEKEVFVNVWRR